MALYECKLVYKGYVQELFFREGESESGILSELLQFQWSKGQWTITEAEEKTK